jgi:hypothetical protein
LAALVYHLRDRDNIKAFTELATVRRVGEEWCVYHGHKVWKLGAHACAFLFAGGSKKGDNTNAAVADAGSADPSLTQLESTDGAKPAAA